MGAPSPFNHLWYMSILGQLYIVYPIFFGVAIHYFRTTKKMFRLVIGIIFSSAILMGLLYFLSDNLNRIYYGTDTRLFSFSVGVLLAVTQYNLDNNKKALSIKSQYALLVISLFGMFYFVMNIYDYQVFNYVGGMLLFSFFVALALWSILDQRNLFNRLCSNTLIDYLSKRSFQIYLWQYPVIIVYDDMASMQANNYWIHLIIKLLIILFFSELSYRLVEVKGYQWFKRVSTDSKFRVKKLSLWVGTAVILSLTVFSLIVAPTSTGFEQEMQDEFLENQEIVEDTSNEHAEHHPFEDDLLAKGFTDSAIQEANRMEPIAVGDSILLNIAPELNNIFPNAIIDADIGRQLYNSYETFHYLQSQYPDSQHVLILLGSNGNFKKVDLQETISIFSESTEIYLVNTTVPKA